MSLAAQTYIVTLYSETHYVSHLFVKVYDELELVDTMRVPSFIEKELFTESLKRKWYKEGTVELTITNRKIFNLEFVKDLFNQHKAVVVDIGKEKSSVVTYQDGIFSIKEESFGFGDGFLNILAKLDKRNSFFDTLPVQLQRAQLFDYLAEKQLYSSRLPATVTERIVEFATATEVIKQLYVEFPQYFSVSTIKSRVNAEKSPTMGIMVLTGEVVWDHFQTKPHSPSEGLTLLSLLNGAELEGIWRVYQDGGSLVPAIGRLRKEGSIDLGVDRFLKLLGTTITLNHSLPMGTELGTLWFDLGYRNQQEVTVLAGEIIRLPFERGGAGAVRFVLNKGVSIKGIPANAKDAGNVDIMGGSLGIVIDARRRPLDISSRGKDLFVKDLEAVGVGIE